jgi:hypothetical protein
MPNLPVADAGSLTTRAARWWHRAVVSGLFAIGGCATMPGPDAGEWRAVTLPGKASTHYTWGVKEGRRALSADADRSASLWRRALPLPAAQVSEVEFSWWVDQGPENASVADVDREDASARVLFAFDGDHARLSARTRLLFDMAEALSGERPPYATLMYVWDATAPVGTVIVNPRSDRVRKIVVDSGPLRQRTWRDHRRDLAADFKLAFGEGHGPLLSLAMMTDSDNTRSRARAWYGPILMHNGSTSRSLH